MTGRLAFLATGAMAVALMGCTDAQRAKIGGLGSEAHVKCWSGGVVIYDGYSTGKVSNEEHSDGYYFRDRADGKLKEVSGNCIIEYKP